MKWVEESVIKRAFGKLQNSLWNEFHITSHYMTVSTRFLLSHLEINKQVRTHFNAKFTIAKKSHFQVSGFILHGLKLPYSTPHV